MRERKKVKRRVRIVKNIDNIDNNTMIEWMWICWGKRYLNVFIEQSGTVLTFLYSQTLSLIQVHSVHL